MDFLRKLFSRNIINEKEIKKESNIIKKVVTNVNSEISQAKHDINSQNEKSHTQTKDKNKLEQIQEIQGDSIKELNNIRKTQSKLFKLPAEKRIAIIKKELGSNYLEKIEKLRKEIIKLCFSDNILKEDIDLIINDSDKKFILKQTNQYFGEKEALEFISDSNSKTSLYFDEEIELTDAVIFRNLCVGFLDDGILTPSEESELRLERIYLNNLTDDEADQILEEVKKAKQKHSIDDLLKKEIKKLKKETFTLNEISDIFISDDKYQIEEEDIRITLLTSLRSYVNFDRSTDKFSLSKILDDDKPKRFEFNSTNYEVIIIEEEDPFILQFTNKPKPQEKSCLISINKLNTYFADMTFDEVAIRDVIYDAVVADLLTKIPNVQPHEFVQHKNKVVKNLNLDVFLHELLS